MFNATQKHGTSMGEPIAYFLTWTCYGTWLHGDPRGSVDRDHNQYGEAFVRPDPKREESARRRMQSEPVRLNDRQRQLVNREIVRVCEYFSWHVIELAVLSNHVHIVLQAPDCKINDALAKLKRYTTRKMHAEGFYTGQRLWTRSGSTRYLFTEQNIEAAAKYVRNQ